MSFSLLIKPASADCNLRCKYCFYLSRASLYPEYKVHRMADEVLERLISTYMATGQPQYVFGWQGGEPTLMGAEFFRKVVKLQQKYGRKGAVVGNGLQTNATLLNNTLTRHLAYYKYLVGVSVDGPPGIHNTYRRLKGGRGSYAQVLKGIERLKKAGAAFNGLVLVSKANVGYAGEVYEHLKRLGIVHHQYIPCVELDDQGEAPPYTIDAGEWGDFLCSIFDQWHQQDLGRVSIRLFDSVLESLLTGAPNVCHMKQQCHDYFLVEYNGDVYPCDFFVEPKLKLGNIMEDSWSDLRESATYLAFGRQKSGWNNQCESCGYARLCAGDCLKHRVGRGGGPETLSWLCEGWKQFYDRTLGKFKMIAGEIKRRGLGT